MLQCDHYMPPDRYNPIVEGYLRDTGFYYVSQIGVVQCQSTLVNALIERWRPETHTFYFPVGECAVTLEDVALILGLLTNGLPVTGPTLSSYEALEPEQFTPYISDTHSADYLTPPVHQQYWSVPHQESGEQDLFSQLLGFMALVPGYSYPAYRDIPTDQRAQPSGIAPGRLSLDTKPRQLTFSNTSGGRLSVDSSMSDDAMRGIIQSENLRRVPMSLILESYQPVDEDNDDFLVDHPDGDGDEDADADEDEDEDDDEDEEDGEDDDDDGG
ncbi:hypothetical protein Ahy_B04g069661 [Arachis hypogaea]|uniref:Aminotransferase-like plant mobile domain-containing protein n=1 Tax=Arachis hypogaea TaxID=3818 RepID=A0A444ZD60_ARAHY|nr:hypothetical protein Ahy_B04g069661 [Arachis hypogaea]